MRRKTFAKRLALKSGNSIKATENLLRAFEDSVMEMMAYERYTLFTFGWLGGRQMIVPAVWGLYMFQPGYHLYPEDYLIKRGRPFFIPSRLVKKNKFRMKKYEEYKRRRAQQQFYKLLQRGDQNAQSHKRRINATKKI